MTACRDGYGRATRDGWSLWLDRSTWREEWWAEVLRAIDGRDEPFSVSRHARTSVVRLPVEGRIVRAFAKVYRPASWRGEIKDLWRASKAVHALRASAALAGDGFAVARVVAAGEERRLRRLRRAFLLTEEVQWPALCRLAENAAHRPARSQRALRRGVAASLGAEIGRLHRLGWVHGDLVATNILVDEGPPPRFCLLDNDRTRRVAAARREFLQRRNLIQLNRLPLAGVSNGDRLLFFAHYAEIRGWPPERRRVEARRLAEATRQRRIELEGIAARKAAGAAVP